MTNSSFLLAVDGGGTKTTAWIANPQGEILGKATTGPMSLAAVSPTEASHNFLTAIKKAAESLNVTNFSHVVVGLAGVDTPHEQEIALALFSNELGMLYPFEKFEVVNDILIALESATSSPNAICLISGTGSNCFGRNDQGKTAKTGGMDYLLSDEGSGFEIGRQVLRSAVKSYDGRLERSLLEKLVCQHFGISTIAELKNKVYHPILNKTQLGQLSALCFQAKDQNDTIANEIINEALTELQLLVVTVLNNLELAQKPTDLVLIGGIATDPFIHQQLEARLKANYSLLTLIVPQHPPVYGALQLALKNVS